MGLTPLGDGNANTCLRASFRLAYRQSKLFVVGLSITRSPYNLLKAPGVHASLIGLLPLGVDKHHPTGPCMTHWQFLCANVTPLMGLSPTWVQSPPLR